ncbi:CoA transferase [Rhodococcus qingshengii]|uniref:CoA transferase n=1 Tax=Rhodococcus qingshengii TaxID=334542 RepID=UPI00237C6594|nr:CoA transferase [Rhodococcus qingshengii]WCT06041.1 CoA transferase [Rhodococcus qingshengii]
MGVRVLEFAGLGQGSHAAMVLAGLGADVVRIERPSGGLEISPKDQDQLLRSRCWIEAVLKIETAKIRDFINGWNPRAEPFIWTKAAERILAKADRKTNFKVGALD